MGALAGAGNALIVAASCLGASGVALGAFGAHALKSRLVDAGTAGTWDTAVQYHLLHAVVVLVVAIYSRVVPSLATSLSPSGWLMVVGVVLFSGSLYGLSLGGPRWLGPVTPLGGLAFIAGWLWLLKPVLSHGE